LLKCDASYVKHHVKFCLHWGEEALE
jgi:hypothetical protein